MSRSLHALLYATVLAGEIERDPIPDSDLDDEQPISLRVHITLGELRQARSALTALRTMAGAGYIKITRDPHVPGAPPARPNAPASVQQDEESKT